MGSNAEHSDLKVKIMKELQKKYLGDVEIHSRTTGSVYYKIKGQYVGPYRIGEKGLSDVYGTIKGGFSFNIEVKTGKAVTTPDQKRRLERSEKLGSGSFVCRSKEQMIEDFDKWFKEKQCQS